MNINDVFPSKYLRARDLDDDEPTVTIKSVEMTTLGGDRRAVCYFEGAFKPLILNKTNATAITQIAGTSDTDEWEGLRLRLVVARVSYQGTMHDAVRIAVPTPVRRAAKSSSKAGPAADPDPAAAREEDAPF